MELEVRNLENKSFKTVQIFKDGEMVKASGKQR